MKKLYMISTALMALSVPAFAQTAALGYMPAPAEGAVVDPVEMQLASLQQEWARIKYQVADKDAQLDAIHKLESQAAEFTAANPGRAEPKIWEGIILSTDAGIVKGLSALDKVEKAKDLFEQSLSIDPNALNGSAYTSLGSLYYQVPGWPVAFGDDEKAEESLKKALAINPDGIDPNYFYGDFLLQNDRLSEAKTYLEHALSAPDRPGRELADAGRRQEIKAALSKISLEAESKPKKKFN